jgi:hypothetical protein
MLRILFSQWGSVARLGELVSSFEVLASQRTAALGRALQTAKARP